MELVEDADGWSCGQQGNTCWPCLAPGQPRDAQRAGRDNGRKLLISDSNDIGFLYFPLFPTFHYHGAVTASAWLPLPAHSLREGAEKRLLKNSYKMRTSGFGFCREVNPQNTDTE